MDRKVVRVIWVDPHSVDEWTSPDTSSLEYPHKVETIGRLIKDEPRFIVVSLNIGLEDDPDVSCSIVIPRECIVKMDEVQIE